MTNDQVLSLAIGLRSLSPPNMNGWFNYAMSANLEAAAAESKHIREAIKDSKEMTEYKEQLKALQEGHSIKDKDGKPTYDVINLPNGSQLVKYDIPSAKDPDSEFSTKLKELNEKYDKDIKKQDKRMKFLNEENKMFKPVFITPKDIPDGLTREEMNLILPLVKRD